MIVAFDITQFIYGTGVSAYIENLIAAFTYLNPQNTLFKAFAFSRGRNRLLQKLKKRYSSSRFLFYIFPLPERVRHLSLSLRLDPRLLIGDYDILHIPDWVGYSTSKPVITTIHDLGVLRYPSFFHNKIVKKEKRYLDWAVQRSQKIICVSKTTQSNLHSYYPTSSNKTEVIYEANPFEFTKQSTPFTKVKTKYSLNLSYKYLLSIATLEPRKNLKRLVTAFLEANLKNYQLLIAGKVGWGEIELPQHSQIKLLGYVPKEDLVSLIKNTKGLVYPSLWEGFGLPIAAARAYNIPLLTSNRGSMKEIAPKGTILINPESISDISRGIEQLVQLNQVKYSNPFSWLKTAEETWKLYYQVNQNSRK